MKVKSGYIYILLTAFMFSTMEIALKLVSGVFAPMQITMLRFLVGGVLLIPFARASLKKREAKLTGQNWRYFLLLGFLCVLLSMVFYQMAVVHAPASVVGIVFSSNPIFVSVLAFLILHETIHWNNVAALALEVLGILAIIKPWDVAMELPGILLAVCAAVLFALYGVMGKRATARFGSITVTCFTFIFGGGEMLALLLIGHIPPVARALGAVPALRIFADVPFVQGISLQTLPVLLYICLVVSAGGYVCYMKAMESTSANEASLVFFIKPILAPILAFLILREAIHWNVFLGIGFFLAGSLVSILPAMARAKQAAVGK